MAAKKKNGVKRQMPKANPRNMTCEIEGTDLVIRCSLKGKAPLSKSGKVRLVATSGGFWAPDTDGLPKGLVISGNIMLPISK